MQHFRLLLKLNAGYPGSFITWCRFDDHYKLQLEPEMLEAWNSTPLSNFSLEPNTNAHYTVSIYGRHSRLNCLKGAWWIHSNAIILASRSVRMLYHSWGMGLIWYPQWNVLRIWRRHDRGNEDKIHHGDEGVSRGMMELRRGCSWSVTFPVAILSRHEGCNAEVKEREKNLGI